MATSTVTVLGFDGAPFDQRSFEGMGERFIKAICRLSIGAGSYVAGGLTLDWSNNNGASPSAPSTIPPAAQGVAAGPSRVSIANMSVAAGVGGNGGYYVVIPGTLPTNWKLKIFATAGSEYATGAMTADALTDIIEAEVHWAR